MRRLALTLASVAVFGLIAHGVWSATVALLLSRFYDHRLINIVKIKPLDNFWEEISLAFVDEVVTAARNQNKRSLIFVGSSLTYGYPWQEPVIFSRIFAAKKPNLRVGNLSYIGADMGGQLDWTTCAFKGRLNPDYLIVEIPLVNSTYVLRPDKEASRRRCTTSSDDILSYWNVALTYPLGTGWVSLLWDEESYVKPEEDLRIAKLPDTYFATKEKFEAIRPVFNSLVAEYVESVSKMGKHVFVFVSPIYTNGIAEAGGEQDAVEIQMRAAYDVCKMNKKVECIDPSAFGLRREHFYNLTHLNQRGHRALGEWFALHIAQ